MVGADPVVAAAHGQDGKKDFVRVDTGGEDAVHHLVESAVSASGHKMPYPVFAQRLGRGDSVAGLGQSVEFVSDSYALQFGGYGQPSRLTFLFVGIEVEENVPTVFFHLQMFHTDIFKRQRYVFLAFIFRDTVIVVFF